jgi:hypothetical protein
VSYPSWIYFPTSVAPPAWVDDLVAVVSEARSEIDSATHSGVSSDSVLLKLHAGLALLGYTVEAGKRRVDKVRRPVLFGEGGAECVAYEVDAVHDELGVLLEVEAGRGAMGNAVYRDLIRTSLIVGARFLALGVMLEYRYSKSGLTLSYRDARDLLDAVYASGRLQFPS